ncbi:MAG: hypothetical protein EU542_00325 [Promethearchaeota archaeon]|nr:MAG: hypothetical protein EU542_00325 [Candidatus Lokiarchaeota archaeon]
MGYMQNRFSKKELGLITTPYKTADYIINKLGAINQNQLILDPCAGPGIFIKRLVKKGINMKQIHAYDISSEYEDNIRALGIHFERKDTLLSITEVDYNHYDFIIGNPPYLNKSSSYVRENRKELRKIYGKINSHETYSMFIINSIWRLKEGGKMAFITSDSFMTLKTHQRLRKFILRNCVIDELLLAPQDLFSSQNVSTSPAIIVLTKCSKKRQRDIRLRNRIRVVDRVKNEDEYNNPEKVVKIFQKSYYALPFNLFYIDIEPQIINFFEKAPKLVNYIKGYIGMHTHNNKKYIAAIEGTILEEIFEKRKAKKDISKDHYQIIPRENLEHESWKPYLKRGGAEQYYRPIMEALDWRESAKKIYYIPDKVPFESEGIVISGVSSRLAARYMPRGCYWDSNKAIGCTILDECLSIEYALGLLNSSLYNYLAKGIINNTNSIQLSGIHALPIIIPDFKTKNLVEKYVKRIIAKLKHDDHYSYEYEQKKIDNIIFNLHQNEFDLPESLKQKLDKNFSIY